MRNECRRLIANCQVIHFGRGDVVDATRKGDLRIKDLADSEVRRQLQLWIVGFCHPAGGAGGEPANSLARIPLSLSIGIPRTSSLIAEQQVTTVLVSQPTHAFQGLPAVFIEIAEITFPMVFLTAA